jgi:hypothetical protein
MTASRSASRQSARSPALDAECDQQIIDACMAGDAVLAEMLPEIAQRGVTAQALASRADELRISAAFIRKCRLSGAHPGMRICLNCDARFLSAGSHNRLCRSCGRA